VIYEHLAGSRTISSQTRNIRKTNNWQPVVEISQVREAIKEKVTNTEAGKQAI
jgi:hypothetical protein